jgi:hypothetical protein
MPTAALLANYPTMSAQDSWEFGELAAVPTAEAAAAAPPAQAAARLALQPPGWLAALAPPTACAALQRQQGNKHGDDCKYPARNASNTLYS